ncbi:MAG: helix-turn-helix domain-containing protein [Oscillospiraceae bacterium]|nr:helix-turn-helix domain-containing protein [Oscillospiraceae bacterium]
MEYDSTKIAQEKEKFVERIYQLRSSRNISARKLSRDLLQSESYINKIEVRSALPSLEAFFCICQYFHITPAEFFSYNVKYPRYALDIIENLDALSEDELFLIKSMIDKCIAIHQPANLRNPKI